MGLVSHSADFDIGKSTIRFFSICDDLCAIENIQMDTRETQKRVGTRKEPDLPVDPRDYPSKKGSQLE